MPGHKGPASGGKSPRRALAIGVALAAVGSLFAASNAGAVSSVAAIARLNAQRSASGIPTVAESTSFSHGCARHDNYLRLNGGLTQGDPHDELATNPGFTADGQTAARSSVLAQGAPPWKTVNYNPWETAPIHLSQTLDPGLLVTGYDESFGFSCLTTLAPPRRAAPANPTLYTYPGPGATIYSGERAAEGPFTPGQLVGIPQRARTGPYIYVFVFGANAAALDRSQITAASLRKKKGKGKHRKLKLRTIDGSNPQLGPYIPPGGMVIPVKRLSKGTYKASVTVLAAGQTLRRVWKFKAV